ncbi:Calmodulin-like protein 4, partial [Ophiophagus hannah]
MVIHALQPTWADVSLTHLEGPPSDGSPTTARPAKRKKQAVKLDGIALATGTVVQRHFDTSGFKECFSLYDKRQKGRIKASDLIVVMRSLGTSPTLGEVARHLQLHKIDVNEELDFSTFLTIMYRQIQQEDPRNEILLAMLMVDQQRTGFITVAELQAKLMNLGEKLSKEEGESQAKIFHSRHGNLVQDSVNCSIILPLLTVDNLLKNARTGHNGLVKYEDLIQSITLPLADY